MRIGGFTPFTMTDYPGEIACVVFTQGCPLRCPGCYNQALRPIETPNPLKWKDILGFLKLRVGRLDAVVWSGGEPLYHRDLSTFLASCRDLGFKVGLHTSGYLPGRLEAVLGLVDWVGIDFKQAPADYQARVGVRFESVEASLLMLRDSGKEFEVRTTLVPGVDLANIERCLGQMKLLHRWRKQPYYEVDDIGNLQHTGGGADQVRGVEPSDGLPPTD